MPNSPHEINKIQHHSVIFRVHKHAGITWYRVVLKMERKEVQMYSCIQGWKMDAKAATDLSCYKNLLL